VVASLYRVKPLRQVDLAAALRWQAQRPLWLDGVCVGVGLHESHLRGNNDAPSSKSRQIRRSPARQEVSEGDVGLWSKKKVGKVREGLQQKCSSRGQTPHGLETTHGLQLSKTSKDYKKARQVKTLTCSYL
jgi:hypothetical protein